MPRLVTGKHGGFGVGGFTLLEVIVVLTIVALTMAVVAPNISQLFETSLGSLSRDMQVALRESRTAAVTGHRVSLFWVDGDNGQYGIDETVLGVVPDRIAVAVTGAELASRGHRAGFLFFPDGSSTGGSLALTHEDARLALDVDWLTGRVAIREHGP